MLEHADINEFEIPDAPDIPDDEFVLCPDWTLNVIIAIVLLVQVIFFVYIWKVL